MIFSENLDKNSIIIDSSSKNRWELIDEFIALCIKNKLINKENEDEIRKALIEREKSMSTGIGKSVAIPHCSTDKIKNLVLSIAINDKGYEFNSIDSIPVKYAILLLVPKHKLNQHIKTLAKVAKLFNIDELKEKLLTLNNAEEILQTLKHYERHVNDGKQ